MVRFPGMWSRRKVGLAVGIVVVLILAVVAMAVHPLGGPGNGGGPEASDGGTPNAGDGGGPDAGDGGGDAGDTRGTADPKSDDSNDTIVPGVNVTHGLVDPDALLSAHREAMAESGFVYTFEHRLTKELPNGTTITEIDTAGEVRASPGLTAFRGRVDRDVPVDETTGLWTNGTAGFERVVADGTNYERYFQNATKRDTGHYLLERMLKEDEWRVVSVDDGGDRIRLISHFHEGRLVVDARGRIRRLNLTLEFRQWDDEREVDVNQSRTLVFEVTAVSNVSVAPPDWVAEARNATGRLQDSVPSVRWPVQREPPLGSERAGYV